MFRRVELPVRVAGKLLLHSMPGRFETLDRVWRQLELDAIDAIVCLSELHELRQKSSLYAEALENGSVPCHVLAFHIREGGAPDDREAFWEFARHIAQRLAAGQSVLIHCAGGAGRTAMLAVSVLMALGDSMEAAERTVSRAGSTVETMAQIEMLSWCAVQKARG